MDDWPVPTIDPSLTSQWLPSLPTLVQPLRLWPSNRETHSSACAVVKIRVGSVRIKRPWHAHLSRFMVVVSLGFWVMVWFQPFAPASLKHRQPASPVVSAIARDPREPEFRNPGMPVRL